MTDVSNLRYLYAKQPSTGLFICVHGPYESHAEALADIPYWRGLGATEEMEVRP